MPAFRNIAPHRISGRLGKHIPVIYDKDGWPVPESVEPLSYQAVKHEPVEDSISHLTSPSTPSPSRSPTPCKAADRCSEELQYPPSPSSAPTEVSSNSASVPADSTLPSRKYSHARRRDPGHVPRPRNAFIFFRSHFIANESASGEGQQNEISKHAGKVWNKMSPEAKQPFVNLAAAEKIEHARLHPNYVYAPGRGNTKSKASSAKKSGGSSTSAQKKGRAAQAHKQWSRSSATSSEPESPDFAMHPPPRSARAPRAAAQRAAQRIVCAPSPSPSPHLLPTPDDNMMDVDSCGRSEPPCDDFVPTADIPLLELTPSSCVKKEEIKIEEPTFYVSELPSSIETPQEQFGFKSYLPLSAIHASLPPLPSTESPMSWGYTRTKSSLQVQIPANPANLPYPTSVLPLLVSAAAAKIEPSTETCFGDDFSTFFGTNERVGSSLDDASRYTISEYEKVSMEEYIDFSDCC